ncbi:putative transposase [Thioalkalivibrio nitratireducens DSM 14787]|uniref:Transposase n=1 Tax=Thioalkalivibrio nitratireducens (strain DSM 14787 / UNIQEM 213 / ALEN2) TaxID=1255043 RepID=L0DXP1_THIND|nr:putative transposase [Thioalkalivibrio nitratireducens DSM 14787]
MGREVTELEGLALVRVDTAEHRALWNELMAREHPRGMGPLVGAQLRYLVGSAQGWLGALGFAASALQLAARDAWIGWDPALRERHRHRVVGLNRFLLRPGVSCRNLASWTLGRALRRLGADFEACHGYRPWLVETFIEPPHTGVSLRASNWRFVGETGGRGRQDRGHAAAETRKAIYLYELEPDWRARLGWVRHRHGATHRWNPPRVWMRSSGLNTSSGCALGGQAIDETAGGQRPAPGGGSAARLYRGGPRRLGGGEGLLPADRPAGRFRGHCGAHPGATSRAHAAPDAGAGDGAVPAGWHRSELHHPPADARHRRHWP